MSCANVDRLKAAKSGRLGGTMRSLLSESNWLHSSLRNLQQGWNHFKKKSKDKMADRSTWYVAPNNNNASRLAIRLRIDSFFCVRIKVGIGLTIGYIVARF